MSEPVLNVAPSPWRSHHGIQRGTRCRTSTRLLFGCGCPLPGSQLSPLSKASPFPQPCMFPGPVPTPSLRRRLERRPGREPSGACSSPGAVSVSSPFHIERFAWKTGKRLPLKGLLCSLLGVGREKVFLRLFEPFWLALHPQRAPARTYPVDFRAL